MSHFDSDYYQLFRPDYPVKLFAGFKRELIAQGFKEPFEIADIGCGTGLSLAAMLKTSLRVHAFAVDPDARMIEKAKEDPRLAEVVFSIGEGARSGLGEHSVDAILVGSAFHWMNSQETAQEFARILRPNGILWIFETQFPKSLELAELNEWIRRQFNLFWKAPGQVPRGNFQEVTKVFRNGSGWKHSRTWREPMTLALDASALQGLLLSQSRVLHYESLLNAQDRDAFRVELLRKLRTWMGDTLHVFDFSLMAAVFFKTRQDPDCALPFAK